MHTLEEAFALQADACESLGSPLYARLLRGLTADLAAGGAIAALLAPHRFERPLHDAVALRLLGALHRVVLRGDAPELAALYPSAGGADDGSDPTPRALAVIARHRAEIDDGLRRTVQTNEVGRCATLAVGFCAVSAATRLPLRLLELGSSAGLNLRWDHYWYDTGTSHTGDAASAVRFVGAWERPVPWLDAGTVVAERAGCDLAPLDASSDAARATLLSFVWPDQAERFARLRAALSIAAGVPVDLSGDEAGRWLADRLARPSGGVATVVFHSIVWQYLPAGTRASLRQTLAEAGQRATDARPLAWLRMEPAGAVADLRLTRWPGGREEVLATSSYHGPPVRCTSRGGDPSTDPNPSVYPKPDPSTDPGGNPETRPSAAALTGPDAARRGT